LTVWKRINNKTVCVDLLSNRGVEERGIQRIRHLPGGLFFVTLNSDQSLSFWDAKRFASCFFVVVVFVHFYFGVGFCVDRDCCCFLFIIPGSLKSEGCSMRVLPIFT